MENELAQLSINEEEEEILQIQTDPGNQSAVGEFQLVGCFLTASVIHFPAMKSTMANLWHPVYGVQIRDLGDKRYLFQFYHNLDMERVLKGLPWTFNNHLLLLNKLGRGEDPLKVPLIFTPFWVQIHHVPIGLFFEKLAVQLGNFLDAFLEYDTLNLGKENRNYMRVRVQLDVRKPLKRKKQVLCNGVRSYVMFKYERLSLFCFYCGRLGHNDSFCEIKMMARADTEELGWDLSLRAQSRRALSMNSIWLREDEVGKGIGRWGENRSDESGHRDGSTEARGGKIIDPILGFSIEGGVQSADW
ncbi:hypothetical protein Gorai_008537 [Gossypium raimondii]|uniref:CCHC-type domain-containing protein n=1 Tax=Gossypium raimondii TaxID=29730 RepID=A0A7J8QRN4_GOSRA|nr:hypothetical protein [Gossypium raimondii]